MATYRESYEIRKKVELVSCLIICAVSVATGFGFQNFGMPRSYMAFPFHVATGGTVVGILVCGVFYLASRHEFLSASDPDSEYDPDQGSFLIPVLLMVCSLSFFGLLLWFTGPLPKDIRQAQLVQDMTDAFQLNHAGGQSVQDFTTTADLFFDHPVATAVILRKPGVDKSLVCLRKTDGLMLTYYLAMDTDQHLALQKLPTHGEEQAHFTAVCDAALSAKGK